LHKDYVHSRTRYKIVPLTELNKYSAMWHKWNRSG